MFDEYTLTYDSQGSQNLDLAISERLHQLHLSLLDHLLAVLYHFVSALHKVFDEYTLTYDAQGSQNLDLDISERLRLLHLSLFDHPLAVPSLSPLNDLCYSSF